MPRKKIAFVPGSSFFRTSIKRTILRITIPIYPETGSRKDLKSSGRPSKNTSANLNDLSGDRRRANLENALPEGSFYLPFSPEKFAGCPLKYRGGSILINFKNLSLPRNRFRGALSSGLKRGMGENPGQSRCCELRLRFDHTIPLVSKGPEGFKAGVSQEDLPFVKRLFLLVGLEK